MRKKPLWFGSSQQNFGGGAIDSLAVGRSEPQWPDYQRDYNGTGGAYPYTSSVGRFSDSPPVDGKAWALHPMTDYDALKIFFDGDASPEYLLPGMIIRRAARTVRVEPVEDLHIATRGAKMRKKLSNRLPAGQAWELVSYNDAGTHYYTFKNVSGAAVQVYKWNGATWVADVLVANNAFVIPLTIAGAHKLSLPYAASTGAFAACDYSPMDPNTLASGEVMLNFIDLVKLGDGFALPTPDANVSRGRFMDLNSLQNLDDVGTNQTVDSWGSFPDAVQSVYHSPVVSPMFAAWMNRCGLIVYDETPPSGERALLHPVRRYQLAGWGSSFRTAPPADDVKPAIIVAPTYNVERAVFAYQPNANHFNVGATFGFPVIGDLIETYVPTTAQRWPDPPVQAAVGVSAQIAINEDQMLGPYISVHPMRVSAQSGIAPGAELILTRKHIGL